MFEVFGQMFEICRRIFTYGTDACINRRGLQNMRPLV